jgi:DNA-directed RNA polymerase subunit beta'
MPRTRKKMAKFNHRRIKTTVGRVLFNQAVPAGVPYINDLLTKRNLKGIIGEIIEPYQFQTTAEFLDAIKELGFGWAFKAGLSFNLGDLLSRI